jgi:hypothetical protein
MNNQFEFTAETSVSSDTAACVRFLIDSEVAMIGGGEIGVVMI